MVKTRANKGSATGGKLSDIGIYGQESYATTRRLTIMNLAICGTDAEIGKEHADTFRHVQHPDLRADNSRSGWMTLTKERFSNSFDRHSLARNGKTSNCNERTTKPPATFLRRELDPV